MKADSKGLLAAGVDRPCFEAIDPEVIEAMVMVLLIYDSRQRKNGRLYSSGKAPTPTYSYD